MRIFSVILLNIICILLPAQEKLTTYVNPFVGTGGHGHTFPGATLPFAMVQLSPDTRIDGSWDGCSGYHYSDSLIYGFSHTHLSGTGCSDYGDIAFMPVFRPGAEKAEWPREIMPARFSHRNEKAVAGYYAVKLDNGIMVELSADIRTGIQRYTFPENGYAWITLNLKHRDELLEGKIVQNGKSAFSGFRRSRAWAEDQLVFFHTELSKEAGQVHIARNEKGEYAMYLGFRVRKGESILVKTALSSVDEAGAAVNMLAEIPHWDFEQVRTRADRSWEKELERIMVYGGSLAERQNFYTSLYHCMMHPNVMNDADGRYRGRDRKVHTADGFSYYTVFSLWDTYRALHPLLNIIDRNRSRDFMMTFRAQFEQGGRLPMWELWGNETNCMIGFHSVSVIWNAYLNGVISREELAGLYPAVRAEAMSDRSGLDKFRKKGYLSAEDESESVSKTLEYCFNMACVANIASVVKYAEACQDKQQCRNDEAMFRAYSEGWRNLRNASDGFMTPRVNGGWLPDFDPRQVNNHFTEANAWQYTFAVQHNTEAIADKELLSTLFNTDSRTTGREQADITGLIGQYAHGNEPSHHCAYLFGDIDSSSKYVKRICDDFYRPTPDGLCGNEDCGQMSAWYVFSAMGIYPANPAGNAMIYGHMIFDSVRLVNGNAHTSLYRSAPEDLLKKGGHVRSHNIHHLMPGTAYYHGYDDYRPGKFMICPEDPYAGGIPLSSPVMLGVKEVFRDSLRIEFAGNDFQDQVSGLQSEIYYSINGAEPVKYLSGQGPVVRNTCRITAFKVVRNDSGRIIGKSPESMSLLHKRTNGFSVRIGGKYNPQYAAGGPDGIVDGLKGDTDWRKGRWQGYQGQDFTAVIDMGEIRRIDTLSAGFLQDKRSWIFLPVTFRILVSDDSLHFREVYAKSFAYNDSDQRVRRYEARAVLSDLDLRARYVKIVAGNFGKLPSGHPGAGGEAFIFIDEITIGSKND